MIPVLRAVFERFGTGFLIVVINANTLPFVLVKIVLGLSDLVAAKAEVIAVVVRLEIATCWG